MQTTANSSSLLLLTGTWQGPYLQKVDPDNVAWLGFDVIQNPDELHGTIENSDDTLQLSRVMLWA